jgi:hypothetical protein
LTLHKSKSAMREGAETVASWDFERIIPCCGVSLHIQHKIIASFDRFSYIFKDVIEGKGHEAWVAAYRKYLEKKYIEGVGSILTAFYCL